MRDKPVILVVDDLPQGNELLAEQLVPQGYEIVKAANGEEALEKLSGNQIDLILLDVMMPGMDGFEVTRRVRQDNAHRLIPIILVTALQEPEDRVKGIEAGCDDFLCKPFDTMELLARIRSLLKVKAYNELMNNYRKELESEVTRRTEELEHAFENMQQDIAERKRAEEALRESEEKFRRFFMTSRDCVFITSKDGTWIDMNDAAVELFGYSSRDELMQVKLQDIYVNPEERTIHTSIIAKRGYSEEFPVDLRRKDGTVIHTLITSVALCDAEKNVIGFQGTVRNITERRQAEEALNQAIEKLRINLIGTIRAISLTVEIKDPYTAGHQRRVSNLARNIAQEMGFSKDAVDTIRMAGVIHDIGKLSVPAEILAKPGKITDLEMSLIKVHSQTGYDILKDVGLPYPIAEMVYQHHERLDGSGYPQGLKNGQILLESQILIVADVTEAISSHRPYRAGHGIDAALEEIEKNKGILYDAHVVEACLKLFREKGFEFE